MASGLGVALLPGSMGSLRRADVVYRPLSSAPQLVIDTGLVWPVGEVSPVVTRFVETAPEWRSGGADKTDRR